MTILVNTASFALRRLLLYSCTVAVPLILPAYLDNGPFFQDAKKKTGYKHKPHISQNQETVSVNRCIFCK